MPEFQHFSLHFEGNRSRGKEGEAEVKKESFTLADWPRAFRKEPPIDSHLFQSKPQPDLGRRGKGGSAEHLTSILAGLGLQLLAQEPCAPLLIPDHDRKFQLLCAHKMVLKKKA
eukprot:1139049-Pelagomonas_calceolata.AAC.18